MGARRLDGLERNGLRHLIDAERRERAFGAKRIPERLTSDTGAPEGRTRACQRCGQPYVVRRTGGQRYCTASCANAAHEEREAANIEHRREVARRTNRRAKAR